MPSANCVTSKKNRKLQLLYAPIVKSPQQDLDDHLLRAAKDGDLNLCAIALHLGANETVVDHKNHTAEEMLTTAQ